VIGAIADDITGASDVGGMFAKSGFLTVAMLWPVPDLAPVGDVDVLILDTDSRALPPEEAYERVRGAAAALRRAGASFMYKKIDSGFRGNIGAELDALLDETGGAFAVVVPAFPRNRRVTRDGCHYVDGVPLARSTTAETAVCPVEESFLPALLGKQSRRSVGLVRLETVRRGAGALKRALDPLRKRGGMVVVDAAADEDVATIAAAVEGHCVVAGASALAGAMAARRRGEACLARTRTRPPARAPGSDGPILIVSGSVSPVTARQNAAAVRAGTPSVSLDPALAAAGRRGWSQAVHAAGERVRAHLLSAGRCLLSVPADPGLVERVLAATRTRVDMARRVADGLARAARAAANVPGLSVIVTGGDTAAALCRALGISGFTLLDEIAPGVSASVAIGRDLLLVLKPGDFGGPDFYERAIAHLHAQRNRQGDTERNAGAGFIPARGGSDDLVTHVQEERYEPRRSTGAVEGTRED